MWLRSIDVCYFRDEKFKNIYLFKITYIGSSHYGSAVTNPANIHEDAGLIPGLALWVKDPALP